MKLFQKSKRKIRTGQTLCFNGDYCRVIDINTQLNMAKLSFGLNEYGLKTRTDGWYKLRLLETSNEIKIVEK